jgi:hypothetical protein
MTGVILKRRGRVMRKRSILPLAAILVLSAGGATTAKAVELGVGPGGVYVGPHRDHYRDYDAYNRYDRSGRCRVVIDHRTNRFGEDITVRRRICD